MNRRKETLKPEQLNNFLSTFPLIRSIALNHRAKSGLYQNEDITQEVKMGILIWKVNRPNFDYSLTEWLKIANRATVNEIKNFYRKKVPETVSLTDLGQKNLCSSAGTNLTTQLEGNTTMELNLLVTKMWGLIQTQSFLENFALLLKNDELTTSLIYYRACRIKELAEQLDLTEKEFEAIIEKLPLSDQEIVTILSDRFRLKATPAAIRKARQRATDQLLSFVNGKSKEKKQPNEKTSGNGKT